MAYKHPKKEEYRDTARDEYSDLIFHAKLKVLDKAPVNRMETEHGAWVQAWVWVRDEDILEAE